MILAYIGPGPGYLLDFRGPGPYLLLAAVLVVIVVLITVFRRRRDEP